MVEYGPMSGPCRPEVCVARGPSGNLPTDTGSCRMIRGPAVARVIDAARPLDGDKVPGTGCAVVGEQVRERLILRLMQVPPIDAELAFHHHRSIVQHTPHNAGVDNLASLAAINHQVLGARRGRHAVAVVPQDLLHFAAAQQKLASRKDPPVAIRMAVRRCPLDNRRDQSREARLRDREIPLGDFFRDIPAKKRQSSPQRPSRRQDDGAPPFGPERRRRTPYRQSARSLHRNTAQTNTRLPHRLPRGLPGGDVPARTAQTPAFSPATSAGMEPSPRRRTPEWQTGSAVRRPPRRTSGESHPPTTGHATKSVATVLRRSRRAAQARAERNT